MPDAKAICLESLDERPSARFMRCVVLPGSEPGLALGSTGEILWKSDQAIACELYVSLDERLILLRPASSVPVEVHRAGRHLLAPANKPVVLLGGDELRIGARRYRLHVHGTTASRHGPEALDPTPPRRTRLAAAIALGASVATAGCGDSDGRVNPVDAGDPGDAAQEAATDASDARPGSVVVEPDGGDAGQPQLDAPIDVLDHPPKAVP